MRTRVSLLVENTRSNPSGTVPSRAGNPPEQGVFNDRLFFPSNRLFFLRFCDIFALSTRCLCMFYIFITQGVSQEEPAKGFDLRTYVGHGRRAPSGVRLFDDDPEQTPKKE